MVSKTLHVITFTFFYVFLKILKNVTFYVVLLCCIRFLEHCLYYDATFVVRGRQV